MKARTSRARNVVITRSRGGNASLAAELRRRGFNPIPVETIEFLQPDDWSSVDACLRSLASYEWLVFTSSTGVEFFARRMGELSLRMPWSGRPSIAAVGEGTARSVQRAGMAVAFTPSSYLTKTLGEELPAARGERVLVLRADIADPGLPATLTGRGLEVTELPIYRTKYAMGGEAESVEAADLIVFASPSAVEGFCRFLGSRALDRVKAIQVACIGPVTASAAREHGFSRIVTPKAQTFDSLLEEITRLYRDE